MTRMESGYIFKKGWVVEITSVLMLLPVLIFGIFLSAETVEYVKEGINLAIGCVIPSSFPFMIISDFYVVYGKPENIRLLRKGFCRLLGFSPMALAPFICGNVGGFPIGAKMVSDLYTSGALSRKEAERLLPLCNNPSCAFIVGGVGLGIYGNVRIGFLLLFAVYLSTLMCGIITRSNYTKISFSSCNIEQNYCFVESVRRAGLSSIGIISFISIFSVLIGIIKKHVKYTPFQCLFFSILEVTNAAKSFSEFATFSSNHSLSFSAFALGFGGICVGMQSSVFTLPSGLKMRKYYLIKLLEGLISMGIIYLFFLFN